ncbi:hypothetical protein [Solidesulfovibrio alcoholivorans]|uniref:hypothetical protein n=1 Tax=Solidesulfovibrio alcoholivorans TaxID=81406 RepID=UPI000693829F|nr:hypothetical protein [Solidesulfovibrio alcoholivorans]
MPRFFIVFAVLQAVLAALSGGVAYVSAQSQRAMALRKELGYAPYAPPKAFLDGDFTADEFRSDSLFGPVADFVAARTCPTAWRVEAGKAVP